MGLFDFKKKKTTNDDEMSNLLASLKGGPKKRCLRNRNCEYIHKNTTEWSDTVIYTTNIGDAKKFDSDEEAVLLLKCLVAKRVLTSQEAGKMDFVDILGSFKVGDETPNRAPEKQKKENTFKCLVFFAHYLGKSNLDVIVYNRRSPEVLSKLIDIYGEHGYNISTDSVIVLPSQYYLDIIPNECKEFDDIPEEALEAAITYADNNNYTFPEQLKMFYIGLSAYNTLTFAIPIN